MDVQDNTVRNENVIWIFKIIVLSATMFHLIAFMNVKVPPVVPLGFAVLCVAIVASLFFRWGWLVPCAVAGILAGFITEPVLKGGSAWSQAWETVTRTVFCFVIGTLIGFCFDASKSIEMRNDDSAQ